MIASLRKGRVMAAPDISAFLKFGLATLAMWRERSHQRCRLRELVDDPRLLCDIGVTKAEALAEACRPFWSPLHLRISTAPEISTQTTTTWRNLASSRWP
jgi:uncharacterized protein YjiS (DUF1127 family)